MKKSPLNYTEQKQAELYYKWFKSTNDYFEFICFESFFYNSKLWHKWKNGLVCLKTGKDIFFLQLYMFSLCSIIEILTSKHNIFELYGIRITEN